MSEEISVRLLIFFVNKKTHLKVFICLFQFLKIIELKRI